MSRSPSQIQMTSRRLSTTKTSASTHTGVSSYLMRRLPVLLSLLLISISAQLTPAKAISYGNAANSPGSACKKLGTTAKSGTLPVKCVKSGKKLIWQKVNAAKPSAKPSGAASGAKSSPSATPTASASAPLPAAQESYAINVKGTTWSWSFTYLLNGVKSALISDQSHAHILYLPQGKPVQLILTSNDVSHGFWVPGLSIEKEASPDTTGHLSFTAEKIGTYPGMCNIQCGRGMPGMTFSVIVVSQTEYLKYLSTLKIS